MPKQLNLNNLNNEDIRKIIKNIINLTEYKFSAEEGYTTLKTSEEYNKLRNKEIHKLVKILNK